MVEMKSLDQHLQRRGGRWHYIRRIPARFRRLDSRGTIRTALDTSSLQVARARRDAMVEADNQYWAHLAYQDEQCGAVDVSRQRYEAARTRAKARGFIYTPLPEIALDLKQGRASGVKLLSRLDLNTQLESPGATWLDRSQVSWGRGGMKDVSLTMSAFGKELDAAFQQRRTWLIERGYAELRQDPQKTSVIYKRGYLKDLEKEGFNAATQKLEGMTGKAYVAVQAGRLIEGTVAQKFELSHGPHAMIETQRAFYLVPWESAHAQKWGKRIKGRVLSGGGIDWDVGRTRGIGR